MKEISRQVLTVVWNLLLVYACYMLCRVTYLLDNWTAFDYMTISDFFRLSKGGLMFDTAAIAYVNMLYIVMVFFPFHLKEKDGYYKVTKAVFLILNLLMLSLNLMDSAYFPFSNQRTTTSIFAQFSNEDNLVGIFMVEALRSWYLVVVFVLMTVGLWKLYKTPDGRGTGLPAYYAGTFAALCVFALAGVCGIRGGWGKSVRPITLSNANQYTVRPTEAAIVLNTPFSMIRTIGNEPFIIPDYFTDREQMQSLYNPLHQPQDSVVFKPLNVVQIILESNSLEYYGRGFTPFLDSLMNESLTYANSFANGRISIDAMASVLSSIPRMGESFVLTPSSLNPLSSVAGELGRHKGYHTAFFHGAQESSMGFKAYSNSVGYKDYFGRESYGDDSAFDGHWSIWDEEFLQFFAEKMTTFPEPFVSTIFTATSHHPYIIPERYVGELEEGAIPMHKCIRYTDMAVRRFFETASSRPWYENTLFVICADHTNVVELPEFGTDAGRYRIPMMFYMPDGSLKGRVDGIAQQADIMPTVLGLLGYDRPYVAFGNDLTRTPVERTFAVNNNSGVFQLFMGDYLLQFDGTEPVAIYAYKTDSMLEDNLLGKVEEQEGMVIFLKSVIQQYMERMLDTDGLTYNE